MLVLKYAIIIALFIVNNCFSADQSDAFGLLEFRNKGRLKAFNTMPDSANKIDEDWWGSIDKTAAIFEYTTEIDESLIDDSESLTDYAKAQKTELLLKTIMGSVLVNKIHVFDKDEIPSNQSAPLFSYYTVIDQATDLSRDLLTKIRAEGYTSIGVSDLDRYGDKYNYLFAHIGVPRYTFARWFNEVFKEHEPGFRMQNPELSIQSYDPLEQLIRPNTRVRFALRCNDPKSCDHTDVFKISDEEIEACYNKSPDVPFRHFKPKVATESNNLGNPRTGALGRRFGNPDEPGHSSSKKESIERLIRDYLNARRSNHISYLALKESCYEEVDPGEEATGLSKEATDALRNMCENAKSKRF